MQTRSMEGNSEVELRIHTGANDVELNDKEVVIVEMQYEQNMNLCACEI